MATTTGFAPTYSSAPTFPPANCPCLDVPALLVAADPSAQTALDNAPTNCLWTDLQGNCLLGADLGFGRTCGAWSLQEIGRAHV